MMFIKKSPNSHGFVNPHDLEQLWRDQFDFIHREEDYAGHDGVRWATFDEVPTDFLHRVPPPSARAA